MKINFNYCGSDELESDLIFLGKFKERYLDVISGRREVNDDEQELTRLKWLLDAEGTLAELLRVVKEAEVIEPIESKNQ